MVGISYLFTIWVIFCLSFVFGILFLAKAEMGSPGARLAQPLKIHVLQNPDHSSTQMLRFTDFYRVFVPPHNIPGSAPTSDCLKWNYFPNLLEWSSQVTEHSEVFPCHSSLGAALLAGRKLPIPWQTIGTIAESTLWVHLARIVSALALFAEKQPCWRFKDTLFFVMHTDRMPLQPTWQTAWPRDDPSAGLLLCVLEAW